MALDGIFLRALKDELSEALFEARIDKIYQPAKDDVVFTWRQRGGFDGARDKLGIVVGSGGLKTLMSSRANSPRVHITSLTLENPAAPPMFCMVLRKHLMGARLLEIRQDGLERALYFDFSAVNEMGDIVKITLAVEVMGRHSNLILIDGNGKVVDSLKRVPPDKSSVRPILPGVIYEIPPKSEDKLDFSAVEASVIIDKIKGCGEPLDKALLDAILGLSPLICREIAFLTLGERYPDFPVFSLDETQLERLKAALSKVGGRLKNCEMRIPYVILNKEDKPIEFSFMPITQYGLDFVGKRYDSFSGLIDEYYQKRDSLDRMRQMGSDINQLVNNAVNRLTKKLNSQKLELEKSLDRERYKIFGDLIYANSYRLEKGDIELACENFYDNNSEAKIPLDKRLTPSQNAQIYFKKYRKAANAEEILKEQISIGSAELEYLKSVQDALTRCTTSSELEQMREELRESGYMRRRGRLGKNGRAGGKSDGKIGGKKLDFLEFETADGFRILVGRNNIQNDRLTLKTAGKSDLWFHTKDIPGSHTVLFTDGAEPSDSAIETAAMIAAYHSKGAESSQVPVDYTEIKNVKKPSGAKPGMVIYEHNRTIYVTPSADLADRFKKKEDKING